MAAFLFIAQPQVVEARREDEPRAEHRCQHEVLPELRHQQRQPGQGCGPKRDRDVMLDPRELLGSSQVAKQSGSGHDHQAKGESPDLALTQQLRLESERDRDQYHAGKDQKAAVALRLVGHRRGRKPLGWDRWGLHRAAGSLNVELTGWRDHSDPGCERHPRAQRWRPRRSPHPRGRSRGAACPA